MQQDKYGTQIFISGNKEYFKNRILATMLKTHEVFISQCHITLIHILGICCTCSKQVPIEHATECQEYVHSHMRASV